MKHDVTNRQLFLLGGVGAVCVVVIAVDILISAKD